MIQVHLIFSIILLLFLVGLSLFYFRKRISFAVAGLGVLAFLISSRCLEGLLHYFVLRPQADGSIVMIRQHPLLYVIYGITTAAVFEESARYFAFSLLQKKRPLHFSDSLAYGLGHGGIEVLLLGVVTLLNFLLLSQAAAQGNTALLAKLPAAMLRSFHQLQIWDLYLVVLERILAFGIQLLLSIWVWKAVKEKAFSYFLAALFFHAVFDLVPVMVQVEWFQKGLWLEILLFIEWLLFYFITRNMLRKQVTSWD